MDTPVLIILFNRPDYSRTVLDRVRLYHPSRLFLFQDGPREGNEQDLTGVLAVRRVVEELLDWPCDCQTLFMDDNLGCGPGPAKAIEWFFSNVDCGIILEDDAVPGEDFFEYASLLLQKYQNDNSVKAIGSMNVDSHPWGDGSYYFSRMNRNLCAWATWKRAWDSFDINMESVSRFRLSRALRKYHCDMTEREYWRDRLDEIHRDCCNGASWDMQFFMSIWLSGGKGIIPNVNLSSNIGTVGNATHQMAAGNVIDNVPTSSILPLVHPSSSDVQTDADREFHYLYFEPNKIGWPFYLRVYNILNRRIKKALGIEGRIIKRNNEG